MDILNVRTVPGGPFVSIPAIKGDPGDKGDKGDKGDPGVGVPSGGSANQLLAKASSADGDTQWVDAPNSYTHPDTHSADIIVDGTNNKAYTAAEKTKLSGIATNANNYVHPSTAGNKHIPTGGTVGQVLKNTASGTATWQNEYSYTHPATHSISEISGLQTTLTTLQNNDSAMSNSGAIAGLVVLTQAQYDALGSTPNTDKKIYFIKG